MSGEQMRAAVYHGRSDVRLGMVSKPVPGPGELIIRVEVAGICGTDAHEFAHGPLIFPLSSRHPASGHLGPLIPGHELAGIVDSWGADVSGFEAGDRVVTGAGVSCGVCHWCRRDRTNLCERYATVGLSMNGGLAHYVAAPASTCMSVPQGMSAEVAALAQPMAIAVHALRRGRPEPGDCAVVVGAGGIGAFLTFALADCVRHVVVSDLDTARLGIARELGANSVVKAEGDALYRHFKENSLVPSVIYEVSGSAAGLKQALACAPRGARIVLVGLQSHEMPLNLREAALSELEVIGTNAHVVTQDLPEALRLLASRTYGWHDIAPTVLGLDQLVEQGLRPLAEGRSPQIKTLIDPWAEVSRTSGAAAV